MAKKKVSEMTHEEKVERKIKKQYSAYLEGVSADQSPMSLIRFKEGLAIALKADDIELSESTLKSLKALGFEVKRQAAEKGQYAGIETNYAVNKDASLRATGWFRTTKNSLQVNIDRANLIIKMGAVLGVTPSE